jgi:hypothetical protein
MMRGHRVISVLSRHVSLLPLKGETAVEYFEAALHLTVVSSDHHSISSATMEASLSLTQSKVMT